MSAQDRRHWDRRHAEQGMAPVEAGGPPPPPPAFAHVAELFPRGGRALEVACGRGRGVAWLASRGMEVTAVDVSPVAVELARSLLEEMGLSELARIEVHDLDRGLPEGPPVDLLMCYLYRDARLDGPMMERLAPGGMLAIATLSEVGAAPGRFRGRPGALREAFASLETLEEGEADGMAWLLARRPS